MDKLQKDIINLLTDDARYTVKKIAQILNEKEDKIESIIDDMEKSGVIVKYTTIINSEEYSDDNVQALIEVRVTPEPSKGFEAIAEEIASFDEVDSIYLMSGGYDFCVILKGKSLREVAMFVSERLSTLGGVISTATHFILKKYKIDGVKLSADSERRMAVGA
ncbi:transcriptional regulators [Acidaminococcus sp. CAG:917]|nr:transcriptional regulators [Acidaminococcus sp. CAG:917]